MAAYKLRGVTIWQVEMRVGDSIWWKKLLQVRNEIYSLAPDAVMLSLPALARKERVALVYELLQAPRPKALGNKWVWNKLNLPRPLLLAGCCVVVGF